MKTISSNRGFTLIEISMAIALMTLLAVMFIPSFAGIVTTTHEHEAKTRAAQLNVAKAEFLREQGQAAYTTWEATPDDNQRFLLIKSNLGPACTASTLADYLPTGYTASLGALDVAVALNDSSGPVTY